MELITGNVKYAITVLETLSLYDKSARRRRIRSKELPWSLLCRSVLPQPYGRRMDKPIQLFLIIALVTFFDG